MYWVKVRNTDKERGRAYGGPLNDAGVNWAEGGGVAPVFGALRVVMTSLIVDNDISPLTSGRMFLNQKP